MIRRQGSEKPPPVNELWDPVLQPHPLGIEYRLSAEEIWFTYRDLPTSQPSRLISGLDIKCRKPVSMLPRS